MRAYDCIIVGGGPVGASLACALRASSLRLALIEAAPLSGGQSPGFDDRGLALSPATQRILSGIELWSALAGQATPIVEIHVSERGRFGATRLRAREFGMPALAHVVLARDLGVALGHALEEASRCEVYRPARVVEVHMGEREVEIVVSEGERSHRLRGALLIVADGAESPTRSLLGLSARVHDYGQTAIVATVKPSRPHLNVAYERFTPLGPVALLPQAQGRCGLVYVVPSVEADAAMAADDAEFLSQVQARFGDRLGIFQAVGRRSRYPLQLRVSERIAGERFVVLGNAAHTIHPNGAQGFNLGLREAAVLAELLHEAARRDADVGARGLTDEYARRCQADLTRTVRFSDSLARLYYNDNPVLAAVRQFAMLTIDLLPPLKHALVRTGCGLRGPAARLVQGLPL